MKRRSLSHRGAETGALGPRSRLPRGKCGCCGGRPCTLPGAGLRTQLGHVAAYKGYKEWLGKELATFPGLLGRMKNHVFLGAAAPPPRGARDIQAVEAPFVAALSLNNPLCKQ